MHIAIVDDLESDRCSLGDLLERYFESVGMNLAMDVYESGEAFLQRTTDSEYDLVFLDIFMFFDTKVYSIVTSSYSILPKPRSAAASIV